MKKTSFFILAAIMVMALAGCSSAPSTQSTQPTQSSPPASNLPVITVVNNTGYTLVQLFLSPTSFDYWEEVVFDKEVIETGEGVIVTLAYPLSQEKRYDFKMVDSDGDSYTKMDILVAEDDVIVFTFDDFVFE